MNPPSIVLFLAVGRELVGRSHGVLSAARISIHVVVVNR